MPSPKHDQRIEADRNDEGRAERRRRMTVAAAVGVAAMVVMVVIGCQGKLRRAKRRNRVASPPRRCRTFGFEEWPTFAISARPARRRTGLAAPQEV